MKIACLGWGSLIWNPGDLKIKKRQLPWHSDGPLLPIEFARRSRDGRLTLVIIPNGKESRVLWADLDVSDVAEARTNLCVREWPNGDPDKVVGLWSRRSAEQSLHAEGIARWAQSRDIDAVVWTKLPPRFGNEERVPTLEEALTYLRGLSHYEREGAEEYIRRAPSQIRTPYREAFERELGWTCDANVADANVDLSLAENSRG